MAGNSDPRVVKFANVNGRQMNDLMVTAYASAVAFITQYEADQMGTLAPFDGTLIVDGATVNGIDAAGGDGRPLMRDQDLEQIYNQAIQLRNWVERGTLDTSGPLNNANRTQMYSINVNGRSIF